VTFEWRIAIVGLSVFALTGLVASCVVPFLLPRRATLPAAERARRLAALRLLPAGSATAVSTLVTLAFLAFEPRATGEQFGVALPALAVLALAIFVAAGWRWFQAARDTRRLVQQWLRDAEPLALSGISAPAFVVTTDFPIVAVIGWRAPRLLIARSVLASCSPDELQAILAHEQGHIDRRDNLRRLLLTITPDVLAWLPSSEQLFVEWREAAEEAADDDAARTGEEGRARLASALVKVARLAAPAPRQTRQAAQAWMPASALYRGENLDRRVRRLLGAGEPSRRASCRWPRRMLAAVVALAALAVLETVHAVVETAIHLLP
jgi:Zn-dependent protease with chaperone function